MSPAEFNAKYPLSSSTYGTDARCSNIDFAFDTHYFSTLGVSVNGVTDGWGGATGKDVLGGEQFELVKNTYELLNGNIDWFYFLLEDRNHNRSDDTVIVVDGSYYNLMVDIAKSGKIKRLGLRWPQ